MKRITPCLCLVLALSLAMSGTAFAFTADRPLNRRVVQAPLVPLPAEPKAPSARASSAFSRFQSAFSGVQGVEWAADSDSPKAVWGFRSGRVAGKAPAAAKAFLARNEALFGTDGSDLSTGKVLNRLGYHHVRLQQTYGGLPVEDAYVSVHMDSLGRAVAAESTYKTNMKVDTTNRVSLSQVNAAVRANLKTGSARPSLQGLVVRSTGKGTGALAYKTLTATRKPFGAWEQLIDARTGKVVDTQSKVYSLMPSEGTGTPPGMKSTPVAAVSPRGAWSTVYSQNFNGSWPAPGWDGVSYYNVSPYGAAPGWGTTSYLRSGTSGKSLWPAARGSGALTPPANYPNQISSWTMYGPFNLSNATSVRLNLQVNGATESGYDYLYFAGGTIGNYPDAYPNPDFHAAGDKWSGSTGGSWQPLALDMGTDYKMGDFAHLCADSKAYIVLGFESDELVSDIGPFVDNVSVRKYVESGTAGTTSGTYKGYVYPTTGGGGKALKPMAHQYVLVGPNRALTGTTGTYSTPIRGNIHAWLKGPYAAIVNEDYVTPSRSTASATWSYSSANTHDDEVNLFYHTNKIHDFYKNNLAFSGMDYAMRATAHLGDDYNNAYYSGVVGAMFYGDGDGVNLRDTAKGNDVIYHEYTHGVCDHIMDLPYQLQSGALAEGYADYFACSSTNDPIMGQWVFTSAADRRDMEQDGAGHSPGHEMSYASRGLRNSGSDPAPNKDWWTISVAPSADNDNGWVHHNNMIFSGALWDIRNRLMATHGAVTGRAMADKIIFEATFFWPNDLESAVRAMCMADDLLYGDKNWTNGSPHSAEILWGVNRHGFPARTATAVNSTTSLTNSASPRKGRTMTFTGYVTPAVVSEQNGGQASQGAKVRVTVYQGSTVRATLWPRLRYYNGSKSAYGVSYVPAYTGSWKAIAYFPGSERVSDNYRYNVRPSSSTYRYFTVAP